MTIVTYGATYINGGAIPFNTPSKRGNETHKKTIRHKDIIMIGGRSIRFEYPAGHPMTHRRRSSRSDFIMIACCCSFGTWYNTEFLYAKCIHR